MITIMMKVIQQTRHAHQIRHLLFFLLQKCIRKLRIYIYIYQLDRTDYKLTLRCIQTIPVKQENENKNISNNVSLTQNKE